jgi:hypothetical protein
MPLDQSTLAQFTGTEQYHRFNGMFRRVVATDGCMYVAQNGGGSGAFWLLEAIASHIVTNAKLRRGRLAELQFWKLESHTITRGPNKGRKDWKLTCREDSDVPPAVTQNIPYSDFDLDSIDIWAAPSQVGGENVWVLYLPSEH